MRLFGLIKIIIGKPLIYPMLIITEKIKAVQIDTEGQKGVLLVRQAGWVDWIVQILLSTMLFWLANLEEQQKVKCKKL